MAHFPPLSVRVPLGFPPVPTTATVLAVSMSLTRAQLAVLDVTPITLVAAPGSGKVVIPLSWAIKNINTVASGGPAPSFQCRWAGFAADPVTAINSSLASVLTNFGVQIATGGSQQFSNYDNKALQLSFSATPGGTFQSTARVQLLYYLFNTAI
jgi:hypothetical protein